VVWRPRHRGAPGTESGEDETERSVAWGPPALGVGRAGRHRTSERIVRLRWQAGFRMDAAHPGASPTLGPSLLLAALRHPAPRGGLTVPGERPRLPSGHIE